MVLCNQYLGRLETDQTIDFGPKFPSLASKELTQVVIWLYQSTDLNPLICVLGAPFYCNCIKTPVFFNDRRLITIIKRKTTTLNSRVLITPPEPTPLTHHLLLQCQELIWVRGELTEH